MLNTIDNLNKFESKAQKCIMLRYSESSKGYRVYNTETKIIEELIHVNFNVKLDSDKSNQAEKFANLEIIYSNSKDKESEDKDSRGVQHETEQTTPEVPNTPVPQRKYKQRSFHP